MASGCRSKSDCSHQPAAFSNLRCLCLCRHLAGPSFCIKYCQTCCCGVAYRAATPDPHQCRIYEAAPSFCGVLLYRVADKAPRRCGGGRLVPWLRPCRLGRGQKSSRELWMSRWGSLNKQTRTAYINLPRDAERVKGNFACRASSYLLQLRLWQRFARYVCLYLRDLFIFFDFIAHGWLLGFSLLDSWPELARRYPRFKLISIGLCRVGGKLAAVPPTTSSNAGSGNSAEGSAFTTSSSIFLISSLI